MRAAIDEGFITPAIPRFAMMPPCRHVTTLLICRRPGIAATPPFFFVAMTPNISLRMLYFLYAMFRLRVFFIFS